MEKRNRNKYILIIAGFISLSCLIYRIFYCNSVNMSLSLIGTWLFSFTVCLLYFIPETDTFSDKFVNYFYLLCVMIPTIFILIFVENIFRGNKNSNKTCDAIKKALIVDYDVSRKSFTYHYKYTYNNIEYIKSCSSTNKNYWVGDTIEICISLENENPEVLRYIKKEY